MSIGFKTYTLTESAKAKHALKFMEYEHNDHAATAAKIRGELEKAWLAISKKYQPINLSDFDETKSTYFDRVELVTSSANVGRFGNKSAVYPSVKVGGAYDKNKRNDAKKALLSKALEILEKYKNDLNSDVTGDPFFISQEDGPISDIRFRFKTGEFTKTIFMIGIEPGYKFERVYFKDVLEK